MRHPPRFLSTFLQFFLYLAELHEETALVAAFLKAACGAIREFLVLGECFNTSVPGRREEGGGGVYHVKEREHDDLLRQREPGTNNTRCVSTGSVYCARRSIA
eukprot:2491775-Rhodomonas_salina.1